MACKAAIKGNTSISFEEADRLIDQLLKLENPYTCPHGRPTLISMSEEEIEKKFKRIV
jgi:DNA mismatch repair protein MutL